ncbi:MAG: hypothetical protein HC808_04910 [Candidatus Competibacteraceae bacterium]|nr:hypothetical protein [Candidatus Competibacteraceae bacterium]
MNSLAANDDIPALMGFVRGYRVAVWCPYCTDYHWHGLPLPGYSHREEHCHDASSPYYRSGYTLRPLIEMPAAVWQDAHRRRPYGPHEVISE